MCRRGSAGLAVVATLLFALAVRPSGAGVEVLPDGTPMLFAPWTDAEHTTACNLPDGRICPILTLNNPLQAVFIRSQENTVMMRDVVSVSEQERAQGARHPFFIYNYKYCFLRYPICKSYIIIKFKSNFNI
jgi:hypothetical protein